MQPIPSASQVGLEYCISPGGLLTELVVHCIMNELLDHCHTISIRLMWQGATVALPGVYWRLQPYCFFDDVSYLESSPRYGIVARYMPGLISTSDHEGLPMVRSVPAPASTIHYPSSDGLPMAESDFQRQYLIYAVEALSAYFQERENVYVSGNLFIYYEEGNPQAVVAPDVFVVIGAPKRDRSSYLLWHEPKAPDFVLEITSRSTRSEDQGAKRGIYAFLGVQEYWQYDPTGDYLVPPLYGCRLVDRNYEPLPVTTLPNGTLNVHSHVLGLDLRLEHGRLRFHDPATGQNLLTRQEAEQARHQAEHAQQQAEHAQQQAEHAQQQAEHARQQAEHAQQQAEHARQLAERRVSQETAARQAAEARIAELEARLQILEEEHRPSPSPPDDPHSSRTK
jgi:Uma2 family endonuclease